MRKKREKHYNSLYSSQNHRDIPIHQEISHFQNIFFLLQFQLQNNDGWNLYILFLTPLKILKTIKRHILFLYFEEKLKHFYLGIYLFSYLFIHIYYLQPIYIFLILCHEFSSKSM